MFAQRDYLRRWLLASVVLITFTCAPVNGNFVVLVLGK